MLTDEVFYDDSGGGWSILATLTAAAGRRIETASTTYPGDEYVIAIGGDVVSVPVLQVGVTGHYIQISPQHRVTRGQAIEFAARITGHAPRVQAHQPTTTADQFSEATALCQKLISNRAYRGDSVSTAGPTTAGRIVATARVTGQPVPMPWNVLPRDDFVADCQLDGAVATICNGTVLNDLLNVYVDRSGHTSGGTRVPCP